MDRHNQWTAITLLAGLILSWMFVRFITRNPPSRDASPQPVVVEIRGDVKNPGVYLLAGPTATLADALRAAGMDVRISAAVTSGQSAVLRSLHTGQLVWVHGSTTEGRKFEIRQMDAAARLTLGKKLALNEATEQELLLVPRMKPRFASVIVDRRAKMAWRSLDELKEIPGVGAKTVEKWREFLQVGGDEEPQSVSQKTPESPPHHSSEPQ